MAQAAQQAALVARQAAAEWVVVQLLLVAHLGAALAALLPLAASSTLVSW
jgi:hypothetical protein